MTKLNKTQFAKFLIANGFEAKPNAWDGVIDYTIETARGTFEVLANETDVHMWKPNGSFKAYREISNAQANARVKQVLKANATVWC